MGKIFEDLSYSAYVPKYVGINNEAIDKKTTELQVSYDDNLNNANTLQTELKNLQLREHNNPIAVEAYNNTLADLEEMKKTGKWENAKYMVADTTRRNYLDNLKLQGAIQDKASYDAHAKELKERIGLPRDKGGITQEQYDSAMTASQMVNSKPIELDQNGKPMNIYSGLSVAPYVNGADLGLAFTKEWMSDKVKLNGNLAGSFVGQNGYIYNAKGGIEYAATKELQSALHQYLNTHGEYQSYLNNHASHKAVINAKDISTDNIVNSYRENIDVEDDDMVKLGYKKSTNTETGEQEYTPADREKAKTEHPKHFETKAMNYYQNAVQNFQEQNPKAGLEDINKMLYENIIKNTEQTQQVNAVTKVRDFTKQDLEYNISADANYIAMKRLAFDKEQALKPNNYVRDILSLPNNTTGSINQADIERMFNKDPNGKMVTDGSGSLLKFGEDFEVLNNMSVEEQQQLKVVASVDKLLSGNIDMPWENLKEMIRSAGQMNGDEFNYKNEDTVIIHRMMEAEQILKAAGLSWADYLPMRDKTRTLTTEQINAVGSFAVAQGQVGTQKVNSVQPTENIRKVEGDLYAGVNVEDSFKHLESAGADKKIIEILNKMTNNSIRTKYRKDAKGNDEEYAEIATYVRHNVSNAAMETYNARPNVQRDADLYDESLMKNAINTEYL